jgi:hypothetical protein
MANIPIWPGSSSFTSVPNPTPFGFYDNDIDFQVDADKVARFCAQRLGYPIENVELQDIQFFTAFEQAVTVYGNELYAYKQREDYLSIEGSSNSYFSGTDFSESLVTPNLGPIIRLSEQYGTEAGVGGNVTWHSGSIILTASIQDYDLNEWAEANNINSGSLEVKKVFYEQDPAINRFYDPYGGTGTGMVGLMDAFGWGSYSPAISFLLMPLSFDIQRIQQIEMNDMVRKSNFSFQLINNNLRLFPIPSEGSDGLRVWFQYLNKEERIEDSISNGNGNVNNISQYPYNNPKYSTINSVGRSWIFEYTLALCKEMLGYVRGKYQTVPIPGAEVTLNQSDLIASANTEKEALVTKLRDYFDQTSRQSLLERRSAESTARNNELGQVPMTIFVG